MDKEEKKNRFIELRSKGYSFESISKKVHVSKKTLIEWSKCLKTDIENAKAMIRDTYIEKFKKLNKLRSNVLNELEAMDLKKVPVNMLLSTLRYIESEVDKYKSMQLSKDNDLSLPSLGRTVRWES